MIQTGIKVLMSMNVDEAEVLNVHLGTLPLGHPTTPHFIALNAQLNRIKGTKAV